MIDWLRVFNVSLAVAFFIITAVALSYGDGRIALLGGVGGVIFTGMAVTGESL